MIFVYFLLHMLKNAFWIQNMQITVHNLKVVTNINKETPQPYLYLLCHVHLSLSPMSCPLSRELSCFSILSSSLMAQRPAWAVTPRPMLA